MTFPSFVGRIDYKLALYMFNDYLDMASQAANFLVTRNSFSYPRLVKLITKPFPVIQKGDYWVNINYTLPGRNDVSSTYRHRIYNPID
jgi:hypothetical protein